MGFNVERKDYINKTIRLDKKLLKEMQQICNEKNISLNKFIVKCIRYALDNLEEDED